MLRKLLDKLEPHFTKGGKLEVLFPVFDIVDTFFYTPGTVTSGASHIRDGADMKRVMITLVWCATPALLWGVYMTGYQIMEGVRSGGHLLNDWESELFLSIIKQPDLDSLLHRFLLGLVYFLPIYLTAFIVGTAWELLFCIIRKHELNEGVIVSTFLFAAILPPTIPLWQVALGISFGIVIGKEIFGGVGKNFLNPALVGRAFLYFAYPMTISGGNEVWTAVDGASGATLLSEMAERGLGQLSASLPEAFFGYMVGSIGEVSAFLITLGGVLLMLTGIASWRTVLGGLLGLLLTSALLNQIGSSTNPMFEVPFYWHYSVGGFAFAIMFMATDPVSSAMTNNGRFYYGFLIGFMTILIRVLNPAYPEGAMLAILFANAFAPVIDYLVVERHTVRRLKRYRMLEKMERTNG